MKKKVCPIEEIELCESKLFEEIQYSDIYRSVKQALQANNSLQILNDRDEMIAVIESSEKCTVAIELLNAKGLFRDACNWILIEDKSNFMPYSKFGYFLSPQTALPARLHEVLATSAIQALYENSLFRYFRHKPPRCDPFRPDATMMNWQMTVDCLYFIALGYTVGIVLLFIEMKWLRKSAAV